MGLIILLVILFLISKNCLRTLLCTPENRNSCIKEVATSVLRRPAEICLLSLHHYK